MSNIPLLTKNMDMTLEFFFSQKTSLFVISDCHYNHFKEQVFHYAPLLTTIDYEAISHIQTWDILRDTYFMLMIPKDQYFEEPLTSMIFNVRHLILKHVRENVTFPTIFEAIQQQPSRAYIAAIAITRYLTYWLSDIFKDSSLPNEILQNETLRNMDIRPLFEEKYSTIEPVPSAITNLQGRILRKIIQYSNTHDEALTAQLQQALIAARAQWSIFESHHV